jgi:hypothetical protein
MADYEPQYHRLDQLMRWGAAISWLVEQDKPLLPTPAADGAKSDWRFDEWLSAQPDLTWRYDLPFVQVDGVDTETVLRLYSQSFDECGSAWVTSGGISNPSLHRMRELADQPLDLPVSVARAGLSTTGTEYDTGLDAGKIATLDGITRELKPIDTGTATVSLEAPGRKVWSFGDQKVDVSQEAERTLQASLSDADDGLTWGVRVEDQELGEVSVRSQDGVAEIDWQPGPLAAVKPVLDRLQDLLLEMPLADALAAAFAPEDVFDGENGYVVRVAGASDASGEVASGEATAIADGATWLAIGEPSTADEGGLQFRLAKPVENPDTGRSDITWYSVRFAQTPVVE